MSIIKPEDVRLWWGKLSQSEQQRLQTKYYPNDDFMVTHTNNIRVGIIYYGEKQSELWMRKK